MGKATKKTQETNNDVSKPTSTTKGRKVNTPRQASPTGCCQTYVDDEQPSCSTAVQKIKTPKKVNFKLGGKVVKATKKGKAPAKKNSKKKAAENTRKLVKKIKKTKGITLFGHYHRMNKKMKKDEAEEN